MHRRFAKAIPTTMGSFMVIVFKPLIQIELERFQVTIKLSPECNSVELILHRPVQTFPDPITLRMADFRFTMFNIFQLEVKLVFMVFRSAIKLFTPLSQYS